MNDDADEQDRRTRINLVSLIVILLLLIVGYWVFMTMRARETEELCLESGRRDCSSATSAK